MPKKVVSGNYAAAYAAKHARVEVVAAYPITPQTSIIEKIAEFIANGEVENLQYVPVESEHSAMAACIGASATGARAFTATSAQGLALMHEMLHWAAGARLPVVMVDVNRAMAPPWSVWDDQTDSLAQRDTGWLQFYAENNQEVYDGVLMAFKIGEHEKVNLPVMVVESAFILSHTYDVVDMPEQEEIDEFLPPRKPLYTLTDFENPFSVGALGTPADYYEFRYKIAKAMEEAKKVIKEVGKEFGERFGRDYSQMIELYKTDDAEIVFMGMGSLMGTVKEAVDILRSEGYKVGAAKVRWFRPFPREELYELAKNVEGIAVLDRNFSFGQEGILFNEAKGVLYNTDAKPIMKNYIVGLGGRDITVNDVKAIAKNMKEIIQKGKLDREIEWYHLKR
ncbi:MAG: 2-oxoisovalerate ferredoxin oxidoreductase alpha subunit [Thermococcaceae archaeon]|jgi:2-oxoisovalerate ferredoxin oxidoreductase alpha subunit|uniref:pyruvate ferredoxin oxidoreductase n=1 Tax=Thermococcus TaxID=2263 RepID=UPI000747C69A|nr:MULTISPECIES: pyruvate ferredoxin oxidoreductase [Thermococcus]KUJ99191.1 MAG: 2-ketoisovalerate:ferredoxin oxidoreductase (VOR) subunit alpha [Thermococcales archaeon 44_46]MDK2783812.1 2-oxoisovalerate ferredoxin oxidoreductase alpha subunit [Thermococcaceae archaeon]MCA6214330.1 pyruvate ferredoxin oxidoreductase [Thermococcus bergensis]MDK2983052.1 2-oxoisovalerate ferredoxin oxidoreductase alpha subunit [Thermococcaceae archaeon]MDN5320492.1 2-oxoisovalerate ferredoxin oxidoreductase a